MSAKATLVTHYFFEAKPLWTGRIGAAGVSDDTVQTIPLEAATSLTEGNAYIFRIGRVDAQGVKRATNLTEVSIGELSGTNFINCVRGAEGTAQQHAAGTVVEILMTATHWNKLVEGLGVEHGADGKHTSALVTTLKASGAVVTTGTSDVTIVTPKALADAGIIATTVTATSTTTLTNKRVTKRVTTITSNANPTVNTDNCDVVDITAQAADIASMTTNLSGTPTNFQTLIIRFKDNGTARAITWGTSFEARGVALPTTTVISKVLTVGFIYDTTSSKWGCVASAQEA